MKKLLYCLYKEYLLLVRDRAAMAVTFIMPMALVFIVTLIQDTTFKSVSESDIPLLLVDQDKDSLSFRLENALVQSHFFNVDKKDISPGEAKELVASGKYLVAIVVPQHTSRHLREKAETRISKLFSPDSVSKTDTASLHLQLFFDPITKESFKTIISTSVDRIVSGIEMQSMVSVLNKQMKETFPDMQPAQFEMKPLVTTEQEYATHSETKIIPNSVQHNVPAWTMFAMFFICIPLSGNIIREREDGSAFRLLTMPGSYMNVIIGKVALYLIVSMVQFALMLSVGLYFLPMLGLPQLQIGHNFITLLTIAISSGLAATGFGLLVGTIANSQDQAALFGAIFVVIMAAIGGVWIPTFVMPDVMKKISAISPLNWGLEAFYGVFLRGASLGEIMVQVIKLLVFSAACTTGAFYFQVYRRMR